LLDKTVCGGLDVEMIKMQIVMDEDKIIQEGKYNLKKLYVSLDDFLVSKLGFEKSSDGFYCGRGTRNDYVTR
jgi:hypothetical protein